VLIYGVGNASNNVPADWKTDCVGRMQISLPGEVDIAAMLPSDFIKAFADNSQPPYKFPDGQHASWSSSGFMEISHPNSPAEKQRIETEIARKLARAKQYYCRGHSETGRNLTV
jgi:hypothetical protein